MLPPGDHHEYNIHFALIQYHSIKSLQSDTIILLKNKIDDRFIKITPQ